MQEKHGESPAEGVRGHAPSRNRARSDSLLPASIVGSLVGMLAGTLPATIWYLLFRSSFSPLFVFLPLLIFLGLRLIRGYDGKRGLITLCLFTALGFYLTLLSVQAAAYVIKCHMLFVNVPLITATLIGQRGVLMGSAVSTSYIFPLVFTFLGVLLAEELLMRKKRPAPAPEPPEDETA